MTVEEKLDHIIKRLDQIYDIMDPKPGYYRATNGCWYNRTTGESEYTEWVRQVQRG